MPLWLPSTCRTTKPAARKSADKEMAALAGRKGSLSGNGRGRVRSPPAAGGDVGTVPEEEGPAAGQTVQQRLRQTCVRETQLQTPPA